MAKMSRSSPSWPPPMLIRLYGADKVLCLRDMLLELSKSSRDAQALRETLVQPLDHTDYSHNLLTGTYCVLKPGAPPLAEGFSLKQTCDQLQLLHRAIEALLQSQQGKTNVLCYGYRKKRPSNSGRQLQGASDTETYYTNSIADSLLSPAWQLLLSRIGDTLMLYILLHVSMYSCLGNDCCLQLTGKTMVLVAREWKRTSVLPGIVLDPAGGGGLVGGELIPRKRGKKGALFLKEGSAMRNSEDVGGGGASGRMPFQIGPMTQDPGDFLQSIPEEDDNNNNLEGNLPEILANGQVISLEELPSSKKKARQRPSSWQRKKARRAADEARMLMDIEDNVPSSGTDGTSGGHIHPEQPSIPSTQPLGSTVQSASGTISSNPQIDTLARAVPNAGATIAAPVLPNRTGAVPTGAGGGDVGKFINNYGYTQWPRYMPKPIEMIINRSPIFYCSTFPLKPGFAARHILNVLRSRPNAGKILYAAIFNPRNNPVGRASNMMQPRHVMIPQQPLSIPRKHEHMIPLLESVVRRASTCPYNKLLNYYCPLPRVLRKDSAAAGGARIGAVTRPAGSAGGGELLIEAAQASHPPKSLVPDEEKDLDTLMDELYELEQNADHALRQQVQADGTAAAVQEVPVPAPSFLPQGNNAIQPRRRGKLTGLGQLVLEAESQLDSVIGHSEDVNRVLTRSATAGRRTQPAVTVTAPGVSSLPLIVSESGLASTQPQEGQEGNVDDDVAEGGPHPKRPVVFPVPAPLPGHPTTSTTSTLAPESLSTCFVPHEQVTRFVWAVLRRIVPAAMLGDKKSKRALHKSLRKFISLRRFEQMNVHQVIQKQRISSMHWITCPTANSTNGEERKTIPANQAAAHQRALILWIGWLFSAVVVPLLRTHFFCTESEAYRQQVFYYRKPVWVRLASAAIDGIVGSQFAPLPTAKAQRILESRKLGVAGLRLLPKRVGMRFIVNMGKRAKVVFKAPRNQNLAAGAAPAPALPQRGAAARGRPPLPSGMAGRKHPRQQDTLLTFPSVNSLLGGVHQILKFEASRQPAAFGASVFGYNDTYCKLQPYIRTWKAAAAAAASKSNNNSQKQHQRGPSSSPLPPSSSSPPPPPQPLMPYIVSVDVSRAFDHVDVATLLDLVTQLLQSERYLVVKYSEIVPCMGDIKVLPRKLAVPYDGTDTIEMMKDFPSRAAQWALTRKGKVFVDGVVYEEITRDNALHIMKQHLTANLVKLKKIWHYQCRGIAQGSTLSTLLCCLYLAHVERVCLMPIINSYKPSSALSLSSLPRNGGGGGAGGGVSGAASLRTSSRGGGLTALAAAVGSRDTPTTALHHQQNVNNNRMLGYQDAAQGTTSSVAAVATHSMLLRLVDDWMLVTTHRAVAEDVARTMLGGIPAYNIVVNPDKTKLSFQLKPKNITTTATGGGGGSVGGGGGASIETTGLARVEPSVYCASDGSTSVKWCGLLLNTNTLEIMGDYTRYAGEHISTSLTLPMKKGVGTALGSKLCHYLRPKVHPLLLDPSINSPTTVRVNVYQAFMIGAMKFHCYVRAMPVAPAPGSTVLIDAIEIGIAFMVKLTRPRRVAAALRPQVTVLCDPGISPANVRYLGLHAFKIVLERKRASYVSLLKSIDEALEVPACARCARALAPAVDPKKSTILDAIIY